MFGREEADGELEGAGKTEVRNKGNKERVGKEGQARSWKGWGEVGR